MDHRNSVCFLFFFCAIMCKSSLKYFNDAQVINIHPTGLIYYTFKKEITKRFIEKLLNHSNNFLEHCIL